eukprot:1712380-Rhodomonas_salina.5
MSGTEPGYAATRFSSSTTKWRCTSTPYAPLSAYARATRCPVLTWRMVLPAAIPVRACYAMPGTDIAYARTLPLTHATPSYEPSPRYCALPAYALDTAALGTESDATTRAAAVP